MAQSNRFLQACRRERTDTTPVWFMRQAGRYMPEYRAIRERLSILEICKRSDVAAEVTITAAEILGVDAAIIFADLLLPAEPMGLTVSFGSGDGPHVEPALRDRAAIQHLRDRLDGALSYVADAIRIVCRHFGSKLPLLGFAGAPFTLASYLIEGGSSRTYVHTKRLMYGDPVAWGELMERLCPVLVEFLTEQVEAGAAAIQLFDSWVGALAEDDYRRYVLPYNRLIIDAVQGLGVPVIHFSTGTSGYLEAVDEAGAAVVAVDWRVSLGAAWQRLAYAPGIQGNLDPVRLLAPQAELKSAVLDILMQAGGRPGHIFNLGHGILPDTPVENVRAVVEWVHEFQLPEAPA